MLSRSNHSLDCITKISVVIADVNGYQMPILPIQLPKSAKKQYLILIQYSKMVFFLSFFDPANLKALIFEYLLFWKFLNIFLEFLFSFLLTDS